MQAASVIVSLLRRCATAACCTALLCYLMYRCTDEEWMLFLSAHFEQALVAALCVSALLLKNECSF